MRRLCEWKAAPYTRKVISAHTSFGSHAQYLPQETFAQTAPKRCLPLKRTSQDRVANG